MILKISLSKILIEPNEIKVALAGYLLLLINYGHLNQIFYLSILFKLQFLKVKEKILKQALKLIVSNLK